MARPSGNETARDTRALLLADARELILAHGYSATSVDRINSRAGLSKGTFYHHFKSKSDLLDAVVDQLTDEGWSATRKAIEDPAGGALERFRRFLAAARRWRIIALPQTADIMRAVYRPENSLLRERMRDRSIGLAEPALAGLLEDGTREGVFRIDDPAATARVFLILAYGVTEDMAREVMATRLSDGDVLKRITALGRGFMRAIEALLGVTPGTFSGPDVELLEGMVNASRHHRRHGFRRSKPR